MTKHLFAFLILMAVSVLAEPWKICFDNTLEPEDARKVTTGQRSTDSWKAFDFTGSRMNLDTVLDTKKNVMDVAIMACTIESENDTIWIAGASCDWWLAVYVNGDCVLSTLRAGNGLSEYVPSENLFQMKLKKGTNSVAVYTIRGDNSWWMAFARILDRSLVPLQAVKEFTEMVSQPPNVKNLKGAEVDSGRNEAGRLNRLFPWTPNFNEVPLNNPVITLKWHAKADNTLRNTPLQAQAFVENAGFASPCFDVKADGLVSFDLINVPEGRQKVLVKITAKNSGAVIHQEAFTVNIRNLPRPEEVTAGRRLNNFTVELVNTAVPANGTAEFVIDHDRWMYFTVKSPAKTPFSLTLDGTKIDDPATGLPEAFRYVQAGRHTLALDCGGTIVARTIAEMLTSAINEGPRVGRFHRYDWDYARKWLLPALTHLNRGTVNADMLKLCHDSGRVWSGNVNAVNPSSVEQQDKRFDDAMKSLRGRDGVTGDEVFYQRPGIDNFTQSLKAHGYDRNTLIYTWITGYPVSPVMHADFIATAMNASNGRGRLMREVYVACSDMDIDIARRKYTNTMLTYFTESQKLYPDFARRAGMVLGNFNQINVISLEHLPEVDYKYFLDDQLNFLATNPVFKDLGLVGYWGTHYSDDEMYRWSHRLLRHYVVEGQTKMLSESYGFSYIPGHLTNCDFADGFKNWTVEAAAEDSVKTDEFGELNRRNQNRYDVVGKTGNTFCVMTRKDGKPNNVSQVAKKLIPGKKYMLLFIAGDYKDLMTQKFNPREYGLNVKLEDVEIDPAESFTFIDRRTKGNYAHNHDIARQNLYRVVFTPKKSEIKVTFTDEKAKVGEQLMFNYIQLKPFFPKEDY